VRVEEKDHPVHWLENTIDNFHLAFIEEGSHYYPTQLMVSRAPEGTTAASVRKVFEQWRPSRVNPMARGKYFYVVFSSKSECTTALLASRANGFALSAIIEQRPLMGITAFTNERPAFVKDVTAVSCACHRCYGMTLVFKGLMQFRHWGEACPVIAELVQDVRDAASPYSPSLETLQDVLLCPRDSHTGMWHKVCCYGDCKDCGWGAKLGSLVINDSVQDDDEEKELQVSFQAYETVPHEEEEVVLRDDDAYEAKPKASSRPVLSKQLVSPSVFIRVLESSLSAYQRHRWQIFSGVSHPACCLHVWQVVIVSLCCVQIYRSVPKSYGASFEESRHVSRCSGLKGCTGLVISRFGKLELVVISRFGKLELVIISRFGKLLRRIIINLLSIPTSRRVHYRGHGFL
jgi:hypothetical protein